MSAPPPEIQASRAAIDALDHALVELLARRRALVATIFEAKRALALPLVDPAREEALLEDRRAQAAALGVPPELAEAIFRLVLEDSHAAAGLSPEE